MSIFSEFDNKQSWADIQDEEDQKAIAEAPVVEAEVPVPENQANKIYTEIMGGSRPNVIEFVNNDTNEVRILDDIELSPHARVRSNNLLRMVFSKPKNSENVYIVCPRYWVPNPADAQFVITGSSKGSEDIKTTLQREVFEETGLNITKSQRLSFS